MILHMPIEPSPPPKAKRAARGMFDLRLLSFSAQGPRTVVERACFVDLCKSENAYFWDNDIIGLPLETSELPFWIMPSSRVLIGAFDDRGACVGFCGADHGSKTHSAHLFYGVAPSAQGRGLGTRLAHEAMDSLLVRFPDVETIRLDCRNSNVPSQAIAFALGLQRAPANDYRRALVSGAPVHDYVAFRGSVEAMHEARAQRARKQSRPAEADKQAAKVIEEAWHVTTAADLTDVLAVGLDPIQPEDAGEITNAVLLFRTFAEAECWAIEWSDDALDAREKLVAVRVSLQGAKHAPAVGFDASAGAMQLLEPLEPDRITETLSMCVDRTARPQYERLQA